MDELKAHGWNVEQILVYIWHCLGDELNGQEYPYARFTDSEMGQRLRVELSALASPQASAPRGALLDGLIDQVLMGYGAGLTRSKIKEICAKWLQRESQPPDVQIHAFWRDEVWQVEIDYHKNQSAFAVKDDLNTALRQTVEMALENYTFRRDKCGEPLKGPAQAEAGRPTAPAERKHIINPETNRCVMCGRNSFNRENHPFCDYKAPAAPLQGEQAADLADAARILVLDVNAALHGPANSLSKAIEAAKLHLLAAERAGIEKGLEQAEQACEKVELNRQGWAPMERYLQAIRSARKETP